MCMSLYISTVCCIKCSPNNICVHTDTTWAWNFTDISVINLLASSHANKHTIYEGKRIFFFVINDERQMMFIYFIFFLNSLNWEAFSRIITHTHIHMYKIDGIKYPPRNLCAYKYGFLYKCNVFRDFIFLIMKKKNEK